MQLVGILGGTFNPIHFGHLRMAQELSDALNLDEVRFIPSANPPHKTAPKVSAQQRAEMVQLAINDNPIFVLDKRELDRTGASYTIDTLISLRAELGNGVSLCLMMGGDAFVALDKWHRWQELLNYCHIILVQRPQTKPNAPLSKNLEAFLQAHYTENTDDLITNNAGFIHMQAITPLAISSTTIREMIKTEKNVDYLLPNNLVNYINQHKLYQ
jgi:nicotinate-nucleotide adenylyltransferase